MNKLLSSVIRFKSSSISKLHNSKARPIPYNHPFEVSATYHTKRSSEGTATQATLLATARHQRNQTNTRLSADIQRTYSPPNHRTTTYPHPWDHKPCDHSCSSDQCGTHPHWRAACRRAGRNRCGRRRCASCRSHRWISNLGRHRSHCWRPSRWPAMCQGWWPCPVRSDQWGRCAGRGGRWLCSHAVPTNGNCPRRTCAPRPSHGRQGHTIWVVMTWFFSL